MNWNDLIIIYLACGAPFAVYYFLQNRNLYEKKLLYFNTLLRFLCWIPYAISLVARRPLFTKIYNLEFDALAESEANREREIFTLEKQFEQALDRSGAKISIYEFREIFGRYLGLTLEIKAGETETGGPEKDFFRITGHENKKLGEICLHRRNRRRLFFHQNLARLDFFDVYLELVKSSPENRALPAAAVKLFSLLNDFEANKMHQNLSNKSLPSPETANVSSLETDLWNAEKQKQSPASPISTNLQILTATANLSGKD